ncbi:MAG: T9SS type A sorting domain-containing protein [Bacteroidetes bacterium]|nr:T9SS type A sorting domain-containing protein [Bacteroidota bacterium]
MIKIHTARIIAFVLVLLFVNNVSHAQTISASLGWGTFVQGMSEVKNDFVMTGAPTGTVGVFFYFFHDAPSQPLWTQPDFVPSNGWIQGYDMGSLVPGAKLKAYCVNLAGDTIAQTPVYDITVLPEPSWLHDASLSGVNVAGTNVALHADYAIPTGLESTVPETMTGIGGRTYRLVKPSVGIDLTYHIDTRATTVGTGSLAFGVDLFGQRATRRGIPLPTANVTLDQDFNLRLKVADSIYQHLFSADIPLFTIPLPAFCDISFDAGISVEGMLKGEAVVGNDGDQWGFVRDGSDATSLAAKLVAIGFVRGSFNVLGGLLVKVEGKLSVVAELGGGLEYVSVPASQTTTTFGGNLSVYGETGARMLWLFEVWHVGPKELYRKSFGRMPGRIVATNDGPLLKASTSLVDSTPPMPQYAPQPAIAAHAGRIGVAWIDSLSRRTGLWIATMDSGTSAFNAPVLVAGNEHGVGAPSIATLPDGSAFVAWTQNRYTPATLPDSINLQRLLAAQDVYVAFRDNAAGTVSVPMMMADDATTPESGRAEAEPHICALGEENAMLAWLAQEQAGTSSLYYAQLQHTGGAPQSRTPKPIPGVTGMNRNLQVGALGSGRALAVWTNDPDGIDSTYDGRVLSSVWDGSAWSTPAEVARAVGRQTFNSTALATNGNRAVLGWTSIASDTNGAFTSGLDVRVWDSASAGWAAADGYAVRDSAMYIQNAAASIGDGDRAVISYQRVPRGDSMPVGEGARAMLMRNLGDAGSWKHMDNLPFLSDTTAYVWSALTAFGAGDGFYALTEEQPRDGSATVGGGGVRFGSNERGLVWRSLNVAPDLTVSDRPEPGTPVSAVSSSHRPLLAGLQVWPNPTRDDFTLTYSLREASPVTIEIVDVMGGTVGRILAEQMLGVGTYQTHVTTEGLASGMYWVVVRSQGQVWREEVGVWR